MSDVIDRCHKAIDDKQLDEWEAVGKRVLDAHNALVGVTGLRSVTDWEEAACKALQPLLDEVKHLRALCQDYEDRIADISKASGPGDPDYIEERIISLRTHELVSACEFLEPNKLVALLKKTKRNGGVWMISRSESQTLAVAIIEAAKSLGWTAGPNTSAHAPAPDRRHGYTLEYSPSPHEHRAEYDEEEERLRVEAAHPQAEPARYTWKDLCAVAEAVRDAWREGQCCEDTGAGAERKRDDLDAIINDAVKR